MANKNICDVDLLQSMSKNTNVIVDENGKVNKLNLYNEFNNVNKSIDTVNDNIAQISNPNLLINSDFRNPINQRGQTEYAGTSSHIYTIDRWRLDSSSELRTVTVLDDCIRLANAHAQYETVFRQQLEKALPISNYTLTVKVRAITGNMTACVGNTIKNLELGMNYIIAENVSVERVYIGMLANSSCDIEYIKLEQGSIATPFVPRLYAEELALCQRYYIPYNGTSEHRVFIGGGHAEKTTEVYIQANIPSMRTIPTISYSDLRLLQVSGIPVTSMILRSYNDGKINLHCTVTGATATMYYTLAVNKGGYLIFDAEIY